VYAQRTINYLRTFVQAISTPEISPVVPMLSILNEPNLNIGIGQPALAAWNQEVYSMIRGNVTGTGAGHGPVITLHDGFIGLQAWNGYMRGADRVAYDVHPYIAFTPPYTTDVGSGALAIATCNNFQANIDASQAQNGITVAGEWSLALNDCGLFLNRVGAGVRYDGSYHVQGEDSPARTGDCAYVSTSRGTRGARLHPADPRLSGTIGRASPRRRRPACARRPSRRWTHCTTSTSGRGRSAARCARASR
jgi:glucan 1,3-beta-glucosidase